VACIMLSIDVKIAWHVVGPVSKLTDDITLLHSSTNAHIAHRVQDQQNIMLWEVLKLSAYSPDLFPHYCHIFVSLKSC